MVLLVTERATHDSRLIVRFYKRETGSADWYLNRLQAATSHLLLWPYSGSERADLTSEPVRFWLMRPYYLVYRVDGDTVVLLAIVHTSREIRRALKGIR